VAWKNASVFRNKKWACKGAAKLSLLFLGENRVPVVLISFRVAPAADRITFVSMDALSALWRPPLRGRYDVGIDQHRHPRADNQVDGLSDFAADFGASTAL
jgi:hypothetical protein